MAAQESFSSTDRDQIGGSVTLVGPECYRLMFNAKKFRLGSASGNLTVARKAQKRRPKLYVVARRGRPVYVGITNQPIRARLRFGWSADGTRGYYGYAFRRHLRAADLYVWFHERTRGKAAIRDLETVEAEVAYLVADKDNGQPSKPRFTSFLPKRPTAPLLNLWLHMFGMLADRLPALAQRQSVVEPVLAAGAKALPLKGEVVGAEDSAVSRVRVRQRH